jgi:hypothetical protein
MLIVNLFCFLLFFCFEYRVFGIGTNRKDTKKLFRCVSIGAAFFSWRYVEVPLYDFFSSLFLAWHFFHKLGQVFNASDHRAFAQGA